MLDHSAIVYSAEHGPRCNHWHAKNGDFTYIAKDANSNIYKIGKSKNLRSRILAIRNSFYFFCLDYKLIAFTPGDIEQKIQDTIMRAGGTPVKDSGGIRPRGFEMFRLDEADVDVIIDSFSFQRARDGIFPTGYRISKSGESAGYIGRYDITGWIDGAIKRRKKTKKNGTE